jgi:lysine decarboxylase
MTLSGSESPLPRSALLEAWATFADSPGTPFTIPGHKHRSGLIWPELGRVNAGDVPLFGGLASVKDAERALAEAEARTATAWGADWCRYSTGGSTHANQAVALTVASPGDEVLVARNAHRSTLLGIILAGLTPVWLAPRVHPTLGLPVGLEVEAVRATLDAHPQARAMFLVEPSYVGTVSDVAALAELAHSRGVAVVVDQAWGAHFGFHPDFPQHALSAGADALVFSAHKTLPAYSQGSVVLARTTRLDVDRLERGYSATNTTSPAGSILASVDASCALLVSPLGHELLARLSATVAAGRDGLRAELHERIGLGAVLPSAEDFTAFGAAYDPAKLVIQLGDSAISGLALERALIESGFPLEQADENTIIPIVSMADRPAYVQALCDAILAAATASPRAQPARGAASFAVPPIPPARLTPREAFFARHDTVNADTAIGRISAEVIAPYPPGVPLLVPGETITAETVDALHAARAAGVRIAYAADPSLRSFQVVA